MGKDIRSEAADELFRAVLALQTREECYRFFEDVCTVNELMSIAQRYEVACLLRQGYTYNEIADRTGASTATISRVNRALLYGKDGYRLVFERLDES